MNVIVPVEQTIREEAHRRLEDLVEHKGGAVRPIYEQRRGRPDLR